MKREINDYAAVPPPEKANLTDVAMVVAVLGAMLGFITAAFCAVLVLAHCVGVL